MNSSHMGHRSRTNGSSKKRLNNSSIGLAIKFSVEHAKDRHIITVVDS